MKFYASIAAGVCTIRLGFEPDPDQSPDPGTRFVSGPLSEVNALYRVPF